MNARKNTPVVLERMNITKLEAERTTVKTIIQVGDDSSLNSSNGKTRAADRFRRYSRRGGDRLEKGMSPEDETQISTMSK